MLGALEWLNCKQEANIEHLFQKALSSSIVLVFKFYYNPLLS